MSTDKDLVNKLQNPTLKDTAFSELLDAYQERLYWHIRKIVKTHENADDVLQNTFIRVYKVSKILKVRVPYILGCIELHTMNQFAF